MVKEVRLFKSLKFILNKKLVKFRKHISDIFIIQTMMAANAPMIIQQAMVHGHPAEGVLPSGQVAGLIGDLPHCETLINDIVAEALACLERTKTWTKNGSDANNTTLAGGQ